MFFNSFANRVYLPIRQRLILSGEGLMSLLDELETVTLTFDNIKWF